MISSLPLCLCKIYYLGCVTAWYGQEHRSSQKDCMWDPLYKPSTSRVYGLCADLFLHAGLFSYTPILCQRNWLTKLCTQTRTHTHKHTHTQTHTQTWSSGVAIIVVHFKIVITMHIIQIKNLRTKILFFLHSVPQFASSCWAHENTDDGYYKLLLQVGSRWNIICSCICE